MNLLKFIKTQHQWLIKPATKSEEIFRLSTFQFVTPILIIIMFFITYIAFPIRFGFGDHFYKIPNVIFAHFVLVILLSSYLISKKWKSNVPLYIFPITLGLISCIGLTTDNMIKNTPFVPFYAATVSVFFAGSFLSFKKATGYTLSLITLFSLLGLTLSPFSIGEFFHRCSILYLITPFTLSSALIRKKIFYEIENKSNELLEMSNIQMLAEVSGGIAHEINNPLSIIIGLTNRMKRNITASKINMVKTLNDLKRIDETVFRISKITNSLLDIARKRESHEFESSRLLTIIQDSCSIFDETMKTSKIDFKITSSEPNIYIECIPVQIMQIFINLMSNAIDATNKTKNPKIIIEVKVLKDYVEILFSDNGGGVPEPIKNKILNPFFTTKNNGHGSGLGLSICSRIITSHHGNLSLNDTVNFTQFSITLPISQPFGLQDRLIS